MKVVFVGLGIGRYGPNGSSRYLRCLQEGLQTLNPPIDDTTFFLQPNVPPQLEKLSRRLLAASWSMFGAPSVSRWLSTPGTSIVHCVDSISIPKASDFPLVVTAHDLCALLRPELVSRKISWLKRWSWRRMRQWDAIIVPSQATADDAVSYGAEPDKVRIIRLGVSPVVERPPSSEGLAKGREIVGRGPFILAVLPYSRKKGADILLRAWSKVAGLVSGQLVWVGRIPDEERRYCQEWSGAKVSDRIVEVPNADDELVGALYQQCAAVVVPSRWEGYSFPVAEGLAAGRPVIASNIPVHREFDSPALNLFELDNIEDLSSLLVAAVEGKLAGQRVGFPSWKDVAEEHLEVYRSVIS